MKKFNIHNFKKGLKNLPLGYRMKKLLVTILAFVYLTVSSGATINMHYCMGKLMNWDLANAPKNKCSTCGMDKAAHKGCCKDEHKTLKIEKDQKTSESVFQFFSTDPAYIAIVYTEWASFPVSSILKDNARVHAPPFLGAIPIFILTCDLRI